MRINCTVYNKRHSALGFVYLCSPGGSTDVSLLFARGRHCESAAPNGLYARLCHAFLVKSFFDATRVFYRPIYFVASRVQSLLFVNVGLRTFECNILSWYFLSI